MTKPKTKKTPIKTPPFPKVLPEIRSLIETSRRHVATTANLVLVNLYWNIGRVITQDIQNNEKRAGYGKQLLGCLEGELRKDNSIEYKVVVGSQLEANRFYTNNGFEKSKEIELHKGAVSYLYVKKL